MKTFIVLATVCLLTACITPVYQPMHDPLPELLMTKPTTGSGGGVFSAQNNLSITSHNRAFRAGDVLTVVLEETTQASKKAGSRIGKKSGVSAGELQIGSRSINTTLGLDARRDFNGSSSATQENALSGYLTVVVHQVMPNSLLQVRGEKRLVLNQGEETLKLSGYIRGEDLDSQNRISSLRVANAQISYAGSGVLSDSSEPGWLMKFFTSAIMPF